jgi:hypothetical protein
MVALGIFLVLTVALLIVHNPPQDAPKIVRVALVMIGVCLVIVGIIKFLLLPYFDKTITDIIKWN